MFICIFYLAVFMLGLGFGMGEQIIVARRFGEKKLKAIGSVVDHSFLFLMLLAVAAFVNVGFRSFYVGLARTKVITYTTVFLALVNIVLDS